MYNCNEFKGVLVYTERPNVGDLEERYYLLLVMSYIT